jgi:hypothetical protein
MVYITSRISLIFFISLPIFALAVNDQYLRTSAGTMAAAPVAGSLVGRVRGLGLGPAAGIVVQLQDKDGCLAGSQTMAPDGSFVFYDVPAGQYIVNVDSSTLPSKYRVIHAPVAEVRTGKRTDAEVLVDARRSIRGQAYIDVNSDGRYSPGKDTPVAGAVVTAGRAFAVADTEGGFVLQDLPGGRTSLVVEWPHEQSRTHVVLDLGDGPVTNRVVNIALYH